MSDDSVLVSTRRASPTIHLRHAAQVPVIGHAAEKYHVQAATAEALARHLPEIVTQLTRIADALDREGGAS